MNLAVHLAKEGKNVFLMDADFHGPSLITFFQKKTEIKWINDYLLQNVTLDECLQDISQTLNLSGKLFVAFSNPTSEAIQGVLRINQRSSIKMLQNFIKLRKQLSTDPYNVDYAIIDGSPGTGYSTVNIMLISDSSLFVVKLSNADLIGTSQMISGLYKQLKNRTLVLANLIPMDTVENAQTKQEIQELIEKLFVQDIGDKVVKFLGWIPTDLELQRTEFQEAIMVLRGEESFRMIYTLEQPEHIFSTTLVSLIPILFDETKEPS